MGIIMSLDPVPLDEGKILQCALSVSVWTDEVIRSNAEMLRKSENPRS